MNPIARAIIVTLCLTPYLYFGIRDVLHHQEHRPVAFTERLLHVTLGMLLFIIVPHAYLGHFDVVVPGVALFVAARALDEFVFHRGLAPEEIDLHAKTHFGFLIFITGLAGVDWWQNRLSFP